MKFRDVLAMAVLVIGAILSRLYYSGEGDVGRRPDPRQFRPPPQAQAEPPAAEERPLPPSGAEEGPVLPPASRRDPGVMIEAAAVKTTSSGTAFSVNRDGTWVTARHVTDRCDRVVLQTGERRFVRVRRVEPEPGTDISVLWTQGGAPALPVTDPELRRGQEGFSFGFPQGEPGDVYAELMGRRRILHTGRHRSAEPAVAWSHVRRVPDRGANLSGISGGPFVDRAGRVIGVHVAGSPRRGRSYSTAPESLFAALRRSGARAEADPVPRSEAASLSGTRFPEYGRRLRARVSVAKVVCLVGERWRRGA